MATYRSLPAAMYGYQNVPQSGPGLRPGAMGPEPTAPLSSLYPAASTYGSISAQNPNMQRAGVFVTPNTPETETARQQAANPITPIPTGANPTRQALARQMMATGASTAPVQSPLEGLARALQGGIGGYIQGQENRAEQARDAALGGRLASLYGLDPETVTGLAPEDVTAFATSEAKKQADAAAAKAERAEKGFTQEKNLRKEFSDLSKDFRTQRAAYSRVLNSAKEASGAGDLALIFNYMKVLDPGSTVREGEFATAAASGAFGDRIQGAVQRVISGRRLSDAQRADFVKRAGMLYGGALDTHKGLEDEYRDLSGAYGVEANRVVPDYVRGLEVTELEPEAPAEEPEPVQAGVNGGQVVIPTPETQADYDKIPSGGKYFDPDDPPGSPARIKP